MDRGSFALPWRLVGGVLLFWSAFAVISALALYVHLPLTGQGRPPFGALLVYTGSENAYWALVTFPILALVRRFPPFGPGAPAHVLLLVLVGFVVHVGAASAMHCAADLRQGPRFPFLNRLLNAAAYDIGLYAGIVAVGAAHLASTTARAREREALRLRGDLARAELEVLRMQLQPHFLFNALNAISELVHVDPERADRAVARLGELLRLSLRHAGRSEIAVGEELEFLAHYVELQRLRTGDGVRTTIDCDPAASDLAVPSLLLQPLVENALRHGVRGRAEGRIDVSVRREGARLVIVVEDDGAGAPAGAREGLGHANVRTRLGALHADAHAFVAANRPCGGYAVRIELPARPAPAAGADA